MSDSEWEIVKPILREHYPPFHEHPSNQKPKRGRRIQHEMRDIIDAIFYLLKTGCQWKMIPKEFGNWGTVATHFKQLKVLGVWEKILDITNKKVREKEERKKSPTLAIIDSQSVKTVYGGNERGFDGNKKVKGRKRNITVDILGCLLCVIVTSAQPHDTKLAVPLLKQTIEKYPSIKTFAVDKGYRGTAFDYIISKAKNVIIPEPEEGKKVSKKRWIVERTFAWMLHDRRLSKDYEVLPEHSETMIKINAIRRNLRRLDKI